MRRSKYRVWDKQEEKWYEPVFEAYKGHLYELVITMSGDLCARTMDLFEHESCFPDRYILEEYTGLKDKNGADICEGDIVKAASAGDHAVCEVKWGQGRSGFFLYRASGGISWNLSGGGPAYTQESVEVIGNIHQNPELLGAT